MKQRSTARTVNGIVSAIILCLFLTHAILGTLAHPLTFGNVAHYVLWLGMALVGVHVLASGVTSYEQLTDTVRPPSQKKKQHLVLKWMTGIALLVAAGFHIIRARELDIASAIHSPIGTTVTVALIIALAVHAWTGSKSLLKDLNIDRKYRIVVRVIVSAIAATLAYALLFNAA